ncbi:MAG: MMPL family transporter, partial [Gemmatimonadaceae bacterium]|nr:MMPL family transporter [Gemmatimonadaceae bacterium]
MNSLRALYPAAEAIARRPVATLLLLAAALTPLLVASTGVRPDNSLASWFVAGDPALERYEAFLGEYGSDEAILVGFDVPEGAHSPEGIALQRRIAARLGEVDGVARVMAGGELPPPLARGLVAADGRAAAVVAWMDVRDDIGDVRGRIIEDVRKDVGAELDPLGRTAHFAGNGVLYEGLNQQTMRDTGVFLSLALVVMVVLLRIGLGSMRAVAFALGAPLLASMAAIGVLGLSGRPFTVVGSALPTLVLVIALPDAIHVLL